MKSKLAGLAVCIAASVVIGSAPGNEAGAAPPITFVETFTGAPNTPTAWDPPNWDVTVHSRDADTWSQLEPTKALHGGDCSGPPNSHMIHAYEDTVFQCKDHMMTSLNAAGYGAIYLTPNVVADFSAGTATIRFDVSTLRTASRDWWDVWITPYDSSLQLPLQVDFPDLSGPPKDAVHVNLTDMNGNGSGLATTIYKDFRPVEFPTYPAANVPGNWYTGYESFLTPDAARRDTFEIQISRGHLKIGMPQYNFYWVDMDIPTLAFGSGIVQFGHHSYNPTKDCPENNRPGPDGTCASNTYHWDNVSISPAKPFTMIDADRRMASAATSTTVQFPTASPANSRLRFAGTGDLEFSIDGGSTWRAPEKSPIAAAEAHGGFYSYFTPIPAGVSSAMFRGRGSWQGPWQVRDIAIWSSDPAATSARPTIPPVSPTNGFGSMAPLRLVDTRPGQSTVDGLAEGIGTVQAGTTLAVPVLGRGGVPQNANTVMLNVVATESSRPGFVTVYPCGQSTPLASSVNFGAGQTVANGVISGVGAQGSVCVFSSQDVHLVADVSGFWEPSAGFEPIVPGRLMDTRSGQATIDGAQAGIGPRPGGSVTEVIVAGRSGIGLAESVSLNVVAVEPQADGYLTVYPCGIAQPLASTLNFRRGQIVAGITVAELGAGGRVCVFASASLDLVVDATGYAAPDGAFESAVPARLLESRPNQPGTVDGASNATGALGAGSTTTLQVAGRGGVSATSSAVAVTLTITEPQTDGYVTVYPCGGPRPLASSINFVAGQTVANFVVSGLGPSGTVCLFTSASTHVVVDVVGQFVGASRVAPAVRPRSIARSGSFADAGPTVRPLGLESSEVPLLLCEIASPARDANAGRRAA